MFKYKIKFINYKYPIFNTNYLMSGDLFFDTKIPESGFYCLSQININNNLNNIYMYLIKIYYKKLTTIF